MGSVAESLTALPRYAAASSVILVLRESPRTHSSSGRPRGPRPCFAARGPAAHYPPAAATHCLSAPAPTPAAALDLPGRAQCCSAFYLSVCWSRSLRSAQAPSARAGKKNCMCDVCSVRACVWFMAPETANPAQKVRGPLGPSTLGRTYGAAF